MPCGASGQYANLEGIHREIQPTTTTIISKLTHQCCLLVISYLSEPHPISEKNVGVLRSMASVHDTLCWATSRTIWRVSAGTLDLLQWPAMPVRASDIILDWIHDDGYSLAENGWVCGGWRSRLDWAGVVVIRSRRTITPHRKETRHNPRHLKPRSHCLPEARANLDPADCMERSGFG